MSAAVVYVELREVLAIIEAREDFDESMSYFDFAQYLVGVRALWVDVIRRAAFDWILYRNSRRLPKRQLAQDAYVWLFVEGPDHPDWCARAYYDGTVISSFVGICDALGMDPDSIRRGIRKLTPERIKTIGRVPIRRSRYEKSADATDGMELRSFCPLRPDDFLQEVRFGAELIEDDGLDPL